MPDWLSSLIAAFFGAFGGTLLNRYYSNIDRNNLRDRETLSRLKPFFVENGLYGYLKNHDFGESFDMNVISNLSRFTDYCNSNPDFKFINKELEKNRVKLLKSVKEFDYKLVSNSFDYGNGRDRIPNPDYDDDVDFRKYWELRNDLNRLSLELTTSYDLLIDREIKLS